MSTKAFKLKPHSILSDKEIAFLSKFRDSSDKNILAIAFTEGVTTQEMETLGIATEVELSRKMQAALFARYQYKCSHRVALRVMAESFDDDQLDTIMSVLLLPTFCIPEEKILDEILYAKYSMDEMIEWLNANRVTD